LQICKIKNQIFFFLVLILIEHVVETSTLGFGYLIIRLIKVETLNSYIYITYVRAYKMATTKQQQTEKDDNTKEYVCNIAVRGIKKRTKFYRIAFLTSLVLSVCIAIMVNLKLWDSIKQQYPKLIAGLFIMIHFSWVTSWVTYFEVKGKTCILVGLASKEEDSEFKWKPIEDETKRITLLFRSIAIIALGIVFGTVFSMVSIMIPFIQIKTLDFAPNNHPISVELGSHFPYDLSAMIK
jgi:hypothetical protein